MVTVKINGKEITVEDGTLILDAARKAGYEVPTFCYQADLVGIGSCRMCLVEIEGQKKLQPSCITPVLHGMAIHTESPTVISARASVLEFLLCNHALDCPVCDKGGECELQDAVYKYGPHKGRHAEKKFKFHEKDYILSPVIIKNSNRCVQCMKCVRVCREVVGANVLDAIGRGDHQEETSFLKTYLDCDQDGNCIEVCPVGCFMRLPYRYKSRPWDIKSADTICPYCATGCRMVIEERDGTPVRARAQLGVGLNSETLCVKGRFGFDFISAPERLTTPLVRKFGKLEPASWEEALSCIKDNLASARTKVGGIASARLTNEELYLFQKLIRSVFESPNIDSTSRWDAAASEGFISSAGLTEGGVSVFDCMESDSVLIIGGQITDENPVTDYIVRRICALRNMSVIMASPRAMRLDSSAKLVLRHMPASEGALLTALALSIYGYNADKLSGYERLRFVEKAGTAAFLNSAGLTAEEIDAVAKRLSDSNTVSIMAGMEFLRCSEGNSGLSLLKEVLRTIGKKVTVMPAFDRCNQRGAWEMGVLPFSGPGYIKKERGLGTAGMLEAASKGGLDALYIIGEDVISYYPDEDLAHEALSRLKFLAVQDLFLTETAKLAHVVLPGASFGEKNGTFTNQEGRVQSIKRLFKPLGKSKADLEIVWSIGALFDSAFAPRKHSEVFEEIRKEIPMYRDVSLEFNNKRNMDNMLDNRAALIKGSTVAAGAGAPGAPRPTVTDAKDASYPFVLITGNHLFHSGRLSRKSPTLIGLLKDAVAEISPEDAAAMGLKDGDRVKVKGLHYEAELTLMTNRGSKRGVAFIAENFDDVRVNRFFKQGEFYPRVSITKA